MAGACRTARKAGLRVGLAAGEGRVRRAGAVPKPRLRKAAAADHSAKRHTLMPFLCVRAAEASAWTTRRLTLTPQGELRWCYSPIYGQQKPWCKPPARRMALVPFSCEWVAETSAWGFCKPTPASGISWRSPSQVLANFQGLTRSRLPGLSRFRLPYSLH